MNWFKSFLSRLRSSNWLIRVEQKDDWLFVEITDHFSLLRENQAILYFDLLESVFAPCEKVSLSQKIDQWQWKVGDCKNFADRIQKNFSVKVSLSSDFDLPTLPESDDREFVLHTVSPFNRAMWQEIVKFGMFNLPNMAYGLDELFDGSSNSVFDINKGVMSRFNLKTNDDEFAKFLKMTSPIFLTIDGHLCFCFSDKKNVNELLKTVNELGEKYSLKPIIEQGQIPGIKAG
jgi:hypothetical protein